MDLFTKRKQRKEFNNQAEWKLALNNAIVELNTDHLRIATIVQETIIYYKDIASVECVGRIVNIRTIAKTYSITARGIKEGNEKAHELQQKLMGKVSQNK